MKLFSNLIKNGETNQPEPASDAVAEPLQLDLMNGNRADAGAQKRSGRTEVYSVRVRDNFKGEMLRLEAEIQIERQRCKGKIRKVTEGEVVELMLETFNAARRNGEVAGKAVPLANDVWDGVHAIARRRQCTPAEVVEQLVVLKVAELNLLPRK